MKVTCQNGVLRKLKIGRAGIVSERFMKLIQKWLNYVRVGSAASWAVSFFLFYWGFYVVRDDKIFNEKLNNIFKRNVNIYPRVYYSRSVNTLIGPKTIHVTIV